jgi:hypothetical protein
MISLQMMVAVVLPGAVKSSSTSSESLPGLTSPALTD